MFRRCEVLASQKAHPLKYRPSLGAADWRFCVNQVLACALQAVDADADVVEYKGVQRLLVGRLFRDDVSPAPDDTMQLGGRRQAAQGVQAHVQRGLRCPKVAGARHLGLDLLEGGRECLKLGSCVLSEVPLGDKLQKQGLPVAGVGGDCSFVLRLVDPAGKPLPMRLQFTVRTRVQYSSQLGAQLLGPGLCAGFGFGGPYRSGCTRRRAHGLVRLGVAFPIRSRVRFGARLGAEQAD